MLTCKPGYEDAQRRINAFWNHEDTGRPLVSIVFQKPGAQNLPAKRHASLEERWLDVEYNAERGAYDIMNNRVYYADAMPVIHPNFGPEIFSTWAGCPMVFEETTTWTHPCVHDWETDAGKTVFNAEHPYFKLMVKYTELLIEYGKGRFIVGLTDLHPGGDHVAALRDPQVLAMDLLDNPEHVKAKLKSSYDEYFRVYDFFVKMIKDAGMPVATWTPLTSETSMYVPSNDFSCMISTKMFEEFFLDGLIAECRHYGNSIYHLDGPGALRHLDTLLGIPELDAIQWTMGAGNEQHHRWIGVYKRVLAAGKSVQIGPVYPSDLPLLMEHLPAKGVWLCMAGIGDEETAAEVMKTISNWGTRR
jgi:hypothetical protein